MKKFSAMVVAILMVAVSAVSVFAAGINSAEQAVLDELKTAGSMGITDDYVNQAESYFNTIEMTDDESKQIIAIIEEGKAYYTSTGVSSAEELTYEQKQKLLGYGQSAVAVIGASMSYDKSSKTVTVTDANGKVIISSVVSFSDNKGGSTTGNTTTGNTTSNGVIKTTGDQTSFVGFAVLGAVVVLLAAGGALYLVKTKKEA